MARDIIKRETRNSFRLPKHSCRDGKMKSITNVTNDHDENIKPVISVSTSFFSATNGNEG